MTCIKMSAHAAQLLIQRADLDGSGTVDYAEFLAATLHLARLERDERLYRAFRHFDSEDTGFITREDLENCLQHIPRVGQPGYGVFFCWTRSMRFLACPPAWPRLACVNVDQ